MTYQAGAARRDITPPQAWIDDGLIWLWGYGEPHRATPCRGVADGLDARVVCLRDDDGSTAVLVTLDVGALDPATTDQVRERLAAAHGLAPEQVCVNVSHTHSAPTAVSIPTWQPGVADARADYLALLVDAVVDAVGEAMAALRPATVEFGRSATALAHDRHPIAGVALDRTLDVVRVTGADGSPIAVICCAACHPTSFPDYDLISADFVGHARRDIETGAGGSGPVRPGVRRHVHPGDRRSAADRRRARRRGRRRAGRADGRPRRADRRPARHRGAPAATDHPRQHRRRPWLGEPAAPAVGGMDGHARHRHPRHAVDAVADDPGRHRRPCVAPRRQRPRGLHRSRRPGPHDVAVRADHRRRLHQQPALLPPVTCRAADPALRELPVRRRELRGRPRVRVVRAPRSAHPRRRGDVPRRQHRAPRRRLDAHRTRHRGRRHGELGWPAVRGHVQRPAVVAAARHTTTSPGTTSATPWTSPP